MKKRFKVFERFNVIGIHNDGWLMGHRDPREKGDVLGLDRFFYTHPEPLPPLPRSDLEL